MKTIEEVEMTFYDNFGNQESIELSPMQMAIVLKILGISRTSSTSISCFSDETLRKFTQMQGNPLRLVPRGGNNE